MNLIEDIHIGHGGSDPKYITLRDTSAASPSIYFSATDGVRGRELWISDGQPMVSGDGSGSGTHIVKDIYPGDASSGKYIIQNAKQKTNRKHNTPQNANNVLYCCSLTFLLPPPFFKPDFIVFVTYLLLSLKTPKTSLFF